MKKVTELEHFTKKNGTGNLCFIAYKIENNNFGCSGFPCNGLTSSSASDIRTILVVVDFLAPNANSSTTMMKY